MTVGNFVVWALVAVVATTRGECEPRPAIEYSSCGDVAAGEGIVFWLKGDFLTSGVDVDIDPGTLT